MKKIYNNWIKVGSDIDGEAAGDSFEVDDVVVTFRIEK